MTDLQKNPLTREQFRFIVQHAPLVSIDLVITDNAGHILVGLRNNEPARGTWFVPGGIIFKNEKMEAAFQRIMLAETGLKLQFSDANLIGMFEHFYDTNRFQEVGYGTHYVVCAFRIPLLERFHIRSDSQHRELRWMAAAVALKSPDVHPNTKVYFAG